MGFFKYQFQAHYYFLIFVNDLCNAIKYCSTFLFADYTSFLYSNASLNVIEKRTNHDNSIIAHLLIKYDYMLQKQKFFYLELRPRLLIISSELDYSRWKNAGTLPISSFSDSSFRFSFILENAYSICNKLCNANDAIAKLRHFMPRDPSTMPYLHLT